MSQMRCLNKWPRKVKFKRIETLTQVHAIMPGVEVVTWNTQKRAIAAKITRPLLHVVQPDDEWSRMRRASIAADSWLVGEQAPESEWWDWWEE